MPGAFLWTGARLWVRYLREAGLGPGDRVVLALPPGPGFLYVLIAALCEELTVAPLPVASGTVVGPETLSARMEDLDARLVIHAPDDDVSGRAGFAPTDPDGLPPAGTPRPRESRLAPTPDLRLLLRTSGTTATPRWMALDDRNLWSVLNSHRPALGYDAEARVLSHLPWAHAFGLVLELLPALLDGVEIIRDPGGGRDVARLLDFGLRHEATHLSTVPLTIRRLARTAGGGDFLRGLRGGIVGGAPATFDVARILSATRLRPGYGQTEASPGIMLGDPGDWRPFALGRPLGCRVRVAPDGELEFDGENLARGTFDREGLIPFPRGFFATGDLVAEHAGEYRFLGRKGAAFKLNHGRFIHPEPLEDLLRRELPGIREAMLHCDDGEHVRLWIALREGGVAPGHSVLETLTGLRIAEVAIRPADDFVYSNKGALDRTATHRRITSPVAS